MNIAIGITAVASVLGSGIILLALKQFVFPEWHRPLTVLKGHTEIHYINGYVEYLRSFPSGHSTSVASGLPFFLLLTITSNRIIPVLLAILTMLLCFTRIYLAAHFLGDVLAGCFLGSLFAVLSLVFLMPRMEEWMASKTKKSLRFISNILLVAGILGLVTGLASRYILA